jgi:hypothetical protein
MLGEGRKGQCMDDIATKPRVRISEAEKERRRKALRQADASNRIEGQYRSPQSAAVFEAFIEGEIEQDEILPRLRALHQLL